MNSHNGPEEGDDKDDRRRRVEAYCVKCKAKKEMVEPEAITMKNGRAATSGKCSGCGGKVFKIGGAK